MLTVHKTNAKFLWHRNILKLKREKTSEMYDLEISQNLNYDIDIVQNQFQASISTHGIHVNMFVNFYFSKCAQTMNLCANA